MYIKILLYLFLTQRYTITVFKIRHRLDSIDTVSKLSNI